MDTSNEPVSRDAVVAIPGIMGSSLMEVESRELLWGLDEVKSATRRLDDG